MSTSRPADGTPEGKPSPAGPGTPARPGFYAGRVLGIPIYVAPSWFLVAAVLTAAFAPVVRDRVPGLAEAASYAVAFAFVVLLYLSVLAHELSHSFVARQLGLPVRHITVYLLGGASELEREPDSPDREYLVALAGPLLSLILAAVASPIVYALPHQSIARLLVSELAFANLLVAVFNLLPGLPLDGGRVLRAALWHQMHDAVRATVAAAWAGRGLAVLVACGAFVTTAATGATANIWSLFYLLALAAFLWVSATASLHVAQVRSRLPDVTARSLARRALPVHADVPVSEALRRAHEAGARGIVIVDHDGHPTGLVSEAAVMATPEERRPWVTIGSLARSLDDSLVLDIALQGQQVLDAMRQAPASEYLVVDSGRVYGVLATQDVAQLVTAR